MKTSIPVLLLAAGALAMASCAVPHTAQLTPTRSVEQVERQAPVTYNPNGLEESLQARTAAGYGTGRRLGSGPGFGFGF